MKKGLSYAVAVMVGLAVGMIFMGFLSVRASRIYLEVFRSSITT
jgi:hypothetical protein